MRFYKSQAAIDLIDRAQKRLGAPEILYLEEDLHRALKVKSAETAYSVSDMVNEAVRLTLAEDADDLRDADQRQDEPSSSFDEFVTSLRNSGQL